MRASFLNLSIYLSVCLLAHSERGDASKNESGLSDQQRARLSLIFSQRALSVISTRVLTPHPRNFGINSTSGSVFISSSWNYAVLHRCPSRLRQPTCRQWRSAGAQFHDHDGQEGAPALVKVLPQLLLPGAAWGAWPRAWGSIWSCCLPVPNSFTPRPLTV